MATGDVAILREKLVELRDRLSGDPEGEELVDACLGLTRRGRYKPITARATRSSLTELKRAQILLIHAMNPGLSNRAIGEMVGCDGGRVSEALGSKPAKQN